MQTAVSPTGRNAVLSSALSCTERECPGTQGTVRAGAHAEPGSISSFSWLLDSTPVGDLALLECSGKTSEKNVI